MNKVITDGIVLMPPAFVDGLDVWSSEDGTPGSLTYEGAANATLISADADFGPCLELQKTETVQKLRYMGETPLLPGCYLRVTVRVKAISGNLPSVRVAGWAGGAGGLHVDGVLETADSVSLNQYGEVTEITAIVGGGNRTGVDLVWGRLPIYGHFGIDLVGDNGGIIRVEDITIEDVTSVFLRKMIDIVDVQDYGAIGDGVTDCAAAFEAADADANGRDLLVPEGLYFIGQTITLNNRARFEGHLTMPDTAILQLTKDFGFPAYEQAFGNEVTALTKGLQALFNFTDHETFDLGGRSINLPGPIDVHAVVGNRDSFDSRRVIKNGEIKTGGGAAWDTEATTQTANYDPNVDELKLTGVSNIAAILPGSLIEGTGVGREVYVREVDVSANEIKLSNPLYGAPGSQTYSFKRFKYLLDFSGFTKIIRLVLENIDFNGAGKASGLMLPRDGLTNTVKDCFFTANKDRAITSIGSGCAGLNLDRNQFLSNEQELEVADRTTIAFNVNANDAKIRNNRAVRYKHFCVLSGAGYVISGNHFFQADGQGTSTRTAGIVLSDSFNKSTITGNYIDNSFIEWGDEHDATPDSAGFSFSGLTISDNIFTVKNVDPWFRWIKIKPYGSNHFINGLNISGNVFKVLSSTIERVEEVDESFNVLDGDRTQEFSMTNNSFTNVDHPASNPINLEIESASYDQTWTQDYAPLIPFGLKALNVTGLVPVGEIERSGGSALFTQPYALGNVGTNGSSVEVNWSEPARGKVNCGVTAAKFENQ